MISINTVGYSFYTVCTGLCLIMLLFLGIKRIVEKSAFDYTIAHSLFGCLAAMYIVDMLYIFLEYLQADRFIIYICNACYLFLFMAACGEWFSSVLRNLYLYNETHLRRVIIMIPAILGMFTIISSWWNGWVVKVGEDGQYTRGPLFYIAFIISTAYLGSSFLLCLYKAYSMRESKMRIFAISMSILPLPVLLCEYFQTEMGFTFINFGFLICYAALNDEIFIKMWKTYIANMEEIGRARTFADLFMDRYVSAYYVNIKDCSQVVYRRDSALTKKYGVYENYLDSITKYIAEDVHPDDREKMAEAVNPSYIREKMKSCDEYSVVMRDITSGEDVYYRFQVVKGLDDDHVAFSFSNIDEELRVEEEHNRLIRSFTEDYEFVTYLAFGTDIDTDKFRDYHVSYHMEKKFPEWKKVHCFSEKMYQLLSDGVYASDKAMFKERTERSYLIDQLRKYHKYNLNFRMKESDEVRYYQLTFISNVEEGGDIKGCTLGLHSIDEEVRYRQVQEKLIRGIAEDYDSIIYIDLDNGMKETLYQFNSKLTENIQGWDEMPDYDAHFTAFGDMVVYSEDREKYFREGNLQSVIRQLMEKPAVYVNFRVYKDGIVGYARLKYTANRDRDGMHGVTIGLKNVNEEKREEIENECKLHQAKQEIEKIVEEKTDELRRKNEDISRMSETVIDLLGDIVETRDEDSGQHVRRVKGLTHIVARQIMEQYPEYGLDERKVHLITMASSLHDVGKIAIPDNILLKPGKLTDEEFETMKTHSEKGYILLKKMRGSWSEDYLNVCLDISRYHHEKWDGKGYPKGLKGDEIPISAQIVSIVDCYDALTSNRPYKKAFEPQAAFDMIVAGQCGQFSDKLIAAFTECRERLEGFINNDYEYTSAQLQDISSTALASRDITIDESTLPIIEELAEQMPGGFFIYHASGEEQLIFFNDIMVRLFGCDSREDFKKFTGGTFKGIVHPDDLESIETSIATQISKNSTKMSHSIYRIIRKDGDIRWLDEYAHFVNTDAYGDVYYVFALDITDTYNRQKAEEAEQHRLAKLALAVDDENAVKVLANTRILLADDDEFSREINTDILEDAGATVMAVENGKQAVDAVLSNERFDAILMDIVMPVMNGVDAIRAIRVYERSKGYDTPIIAITASGADSQHEECMSVGAYASMHKPLVVSDFSKLIISYMREQSEELERKLAKTLKRANTDPLTGVKNAIAYAEKVSALTSEMYRKENFRLAVVMCDINNLKIENDTYGHEVGNMYIKNCSRAMKEIFKESTIYRIGGDEFAIFMQERDYDEAYSLVERLKIKLNELEKVPHAKYGKASLAVGLAFYDPDFDISIEQVIKRADASMYENKMAHRE